MENWPESFRTHPATKPYRDHGAGGDGALLYQGLCVSLGMSVGPISKGLERAKANYLGRECGSSLPSFLPPPRRPKYTPPPPH